MQYYCVVGHAVILIYMYIKKHTHTQIHTRTHAQKDRRDTTQQNSNITYNI
jgi:hypothetical protein